MTSSPEDPTSRILPSPEKRALLAGLRWRFEDCLEELLDGQSRDWERTAPRVVTKERADFTRLDATVNVPRMTAFSAPYSDSRPLAEQPEWRRGLEAVLAGDRPFFERHQGRAVVALQMQTVARSIDAMTVMLGETSNLYGYHERRYVEDPILQTFVPSGRQRFPQATQAAARTIGMPHFAEYGRFRVPAWQSAAASGGSAGVDVDGAASALQVIDAVDIWEVRVIPTFDALEGLSKRFAGEVPGVSSEITSLAVDTSRVAEDFLKGLRQAAVVDLGTMVRNSPARTPVGKVTADELDAAIGETVVRHVSRIGLSTSPLHEYLSATAPVVANQIERQAEMGAGPRELGNGIRPLGRFGPQSGSMSFGGF